MMMKLTIDDIHILIHAITLITFRPLKQKELVLLERLIEARDQHT